MDNLVIRLGVLGLNEGNGHPFSFSAIVNGYSDEGFRRSGWPVIHDYLRKRPPEEIGIADVSVTHAWTQDRDMTARLCDASLIDNAVESPDDMIGEVDGILLARHDHERHIEMAMPFLEAGLSVFVDKPLTLDPDEFSRFRPFLEAGKLMSCSALRYAPELDGLRRDRSAFGEIRHVQATVCLDWIKYGVHMVDVVLSLGLETPVSISALPSRHESFQLTLADGNAVRFDALGDVGVTFQLDIFGTDQRSSVGLYDNFSSFKRCLEAFVHMVKTSEPAIDPRDTELSMEILRSGLAALRKGEAVCIETSAPVAV